MADNRCTCYDDLPLMLTVPSRRIGKRGQIRVLKYDLIRYMEGNL